MSDDPVRVRWLKLARDGEVSAEKDELFNVPIPGETVSLGGKRYKVEGEIETPQLDCERHILVREV